VTSASKRKGTRAEIEVVALYRDHLGLDVRRTLAGHADDQGDLTGVTGTTIQVKNYADTTRAIREGLDALERQQASTGDPFGVLWVRRRGGRYVAVLTPEQYFAMWREATA
jgi:hypothetical protein